MGIGHDDGIWPDLKNSFPRFSRPVKKKDGSVAGTDYWEKLGALVEEDLARREPREL